MELGLVRMLAFCVFVSFFISPSVSLPSTYNPHQASSDGDLQHVLLPRKLKLAQQGVTREFGEGVSLNHKPKTSSSTGRVYKKEKLGSEEDKMTEFMGMDYAKVRRRRPIHNKSSLPTP